MMSCGWSGVAKSVPSSTKYVIFRNTKTHVHVTFTLTLVYLHIVERHDRRIYVQRVLLEG